MIKELLVVCFLCAGVFVTAQTPQFQLDSVPQLTLWQLAPNFSGLDSIKTLPSESLKTFGNGSDLVFGRELNVIKPTKAAVDGMLIHPAVSEDRMKVVVPDTVTRQYLRVYGDKKGVLPKDN